jgi:hypothetical protein
LHDRGVALWRAGDVERPGDREERSAVLDSVDLRGVCEYATGAVAWQRVVLPRVPQPLDGGDELRRPVVALVGVGVAIVPAVEGGAAVGAGDAVPGDPAAAEVIERGEHAGDVIRLRIRRVGGHDQADRRRGRGDAAHHRERLQPHHLRRVSVLHVGAGRARVAEEEEIEPAALDGLGHSMQERRVLAAVGARARKPPSGRVVAGREEKQSQPDLLL